MLTCKEGDYCLSTSFAIDKARGGDLFNNVTLKRLGTLPCIRGYGNKGKVAGVATPVTTGDLPALFDGDVPGCRPLGFTLDIKESSSWLIVQA